MTLFLKLAVVAYSLLIIYIQARYQSRQFAKNKTISHFSKGMFYALWILLLTAVMMWGRWDSIWNEHRLWGIPLIGLLTRTALFDGILNRLRKPPRSWWYNDDKKAESFLDRLENRLSQKWVEILKSIYIAVFIYVVIILK